MKIKTILTLSMLATLSSFAKANGTNEAAQPPARATQNASPSAEQAGTMPTEKDVAAKLQQMYPNTTFTAIRASGIAGIYELVMGQNVAYTDSNGRYFIFGHLFDMPNQVDLTAQRQQENQATRRVEYPTALLANAIKTVKGNGSRQVVVFADPNCGYCKKLEQEFSKMDNLTIYTFLYPVLGEDSKTLAIATWCAPNRSKAWSDWMLNQKRPQLLSCVTPLNDNTVLGTRLGVTGTPTLIAPDGRTLPGTASAEKINTWLEATK